MGLLDDKKKVFGDIAALRVSVEGFPKSKLGNSLSSIKNLNTNSVDFLTDLIKSLIGFESLQKVIVDTLSSKLPLIEDDIKKALKSSLLSFISCDINPSIPDKFKHQNINPSSIGLNLDLKKIDFLEIMLTDPSSNEGSLLYSDISSGINSVDFNTFLFNVTQTPNFEYDWGLSTGNNSILSLKFNPIASPNNTLNVRASNFYSDPANNKKLTDLNNDYIDSIKFLEPEKIINGILDSIFGTTSTNKSDKQIIKEAQIEAIINNIVNSGEDVIIDDSYFKFSNEEMISFEEKITNKRKKVNVISTNKDYESSISIEDIIQLNNSIINASSMFDVGQQLNNGINTLANLATNNIPDVDIPSVKLDFIESLIKQLTVAIINIVMSPKLVIIFALNYTIATGNSFTDPIEFMSLSRDLFKRLIKQISDSIVKILLDEVLKQVTSLVEQHVVEVIKEKTKARRNQLLSLTGTRINNFI